MQHPAPDRAAGKERATKEVPGGITRPWSREMEAHEPGDQDGRDSCIGQEEPSPVEMGGRGEKLQSVA